MKEEYRRIVAELGLGDIPNLSYSSRYQLLITKRKLATLLLAKVSCLKDEIRNRNVKQRMNLLLYQHRV